MKRFLWVTDPWNTLDHPNDTTLRLMQESLKMGLEAWWCDVKSIRLEPKGVFLDAKKLNQVADSREANTFQFGAIKSLSPSHFESIQYRTDPPVDLAWIHPLQLLILGAGRAEIVNSPKALLTLSEKLEGAAIPGLSPPTLVSSRWEDLARFATRERAVILKPLHQAQSKGIEMLEWKTSAQAQSAKNKLAAATEGFSRPVLLQRYLPKVGEHGETRLWFVDGKLLAAAQKLPKHGQFKIDMDAGGSLAPARLSAKDRAAAKKIGTHLKKSGVRLAAIDLIQGVITDYNITSPGLIVGMESLCGQNLARPILLQLKKRFKN